MLVPSYHPLACVHFPRIADEEDPEPIDLPPPEKKRKESSYV